MDTQRLFLYVCAFGGVVVIKARFADPDKLRVLGHRDQLVERCKRFRRCTHRVCACSVEHRCIVFGNRTDLRFLAQFRADCDHACDASGFGIGDQFRQLPFKVREIEMAMAVCYFRCLGHMGLFV